jgi:hypothetical protein
LAAEEGPSLPPLDGWYSNAHAANEHAPANVNVSDALRVVSGFRVHGPATTLDLSADNWLTIGKAPSAGRPALLLCLPEFN